MTRKTTNKFSPEVRWAAVTSKIGCTPQTLHDWVKKAEVAAGSGRRSD